MVHFPRAPSTHGCRSACNSVKRRRIAANWTISPVQSTLAILASGIWTIGVAQLLALHGPNLDLLGRREPEHYGRATLAAIDSLLAEEALRAGHRLMSFQSAAEHALIERIHVAASEGVAGIVFNPAGYTHTSVALRDALLAVAIPFVEVHLSNPQSREAFRRHSYFSDIAVGTVAGFGAESYRLGLLGLLSHLASAG